MLVQLPDPRSSRPGPSGERGPRNQRGRAERRRVGLPTGDTAPGSLPPDQVERRRDGDAHVPTPCGDRPSGGTSPYSGDPCSGGLHRPDRPRPAPPGLRRAAPVRAPAPGRALALRPALRRPRTGETRIEQPPRDPARVDPPTSPLDLAAIALAAASVRQAGLPPTGSSPAATGGVAVPRTAADRRPDAGPTTGGTPRPAFPAAVPSALAPPTPSHPVEAVGRRDLGRRRVTLPTRTAGALALVGALAGGGVAVVGGGAVLAADRTPTTGELRTPDAADAAAAAAVRSSESGSRGRRRRTAPGRVAGRHLVRRRVLTPDTDDRGGRWSGFPDHRPPRCRSCLAACSSRAR